MDKETSSKIIRKELEWCENGLYLLLSKFDKKRLIAWIMGERERYSSEFFNGRPHIDLDIFLSMNGLLKRVMSLDTEGSEEANEKNIDKLIHIFQKFIQIEEYDNAVSEDFALMMNDGIEYNENLPAEILFPNFKLAYNEKWIPILESFDNHLILTKEKAEEYYSQNKDKYNEIAGRKHSYKQYSIEEKMGLLYPILISFFCGLQKNIVFKRVFDFDYMKNTSITPEVILNIVSLLPKKIGYLTEINPREFKKIIKKICKKFYNDNLLNRLIYSKENQNIFPLFVKLNNHIFVSPSFSALMTLYFYPFTYKDIFDKETEKRSKEFEKDKIVEEFEKLDYKHDSIKDKKKATLEIDLIAWKNETLYVVEVKAWDIKPFFENKRIHTYRERDIIGIIKGEKYTTKDGNLTIKEVTSLPQKIEFVKDNLSELVGEDSKKIKFVKGLIITKSYPPIKEHEGIGILGIRQIKEELQK